MSSSRCSMPGIEEKVRSDLSLMNTVAQLAEKNSRELAHYRPTATVAEFRRSLLRELDFHIELNNLVQFGSNFADNPRVHFPKRLSRVFVHAAC